ncbi:S66 peptidase family protein [Anaerosporobacter sp.]|uniref:S66 peptidase family protein n=1 Tax=Anaerosporobacter sp. TaxID=1872529 RepID=UPI00286F5F66|nr:LD-carboxypeptidase [Anaerosporobacter sp.]
MLADKLNIGDTIGIISPSHVATVEHYANIITGIESMGFKVKIGANLYKDTYGYLASEMERAEDLNTMVNDKEVKMIFFGGGEGSIELLPYIDYENIKRNPKIFLSYSDGTSILNAIYSKTGLITYYGQAPGNLIESQQYNVEQFYSHIVRRDASNFISNSKWYSLHDGICEGTLIGGYTVNFALSLNTPYFQIDKNKKYVLFLEDHECFNCVAAVSTFLSYIEQNDFIENVSGLVFGNYSDTLSKQLLERLERFGQKHNVPVVYNDDFGHGSNHAILPIGGEVILDTNQKTMRFL